MKTIRRIALPLILVVAALILWLLVAPSRLWFNRTNAIEASAAMGEQLVDRYACRECHQIKGQGALKGPNLDGVTERLDEETLRLWLRDPRAVRSGTAMPDFHLSDPEIEALVLYLEAIDEDN